jgi:hypothetical protein
MVSRSGILGWNHALHCEFEQGGLGARLKAALDRASITGGISGVARIPANSAVSGTAGRAR